MARPRIQKIFSDLGGNRLRSALVLASIAVGLFAIGVVGTIYVAAPQDMQKGYEATNPANIYVQTSLFDRGLVEHIQGVDGVRQAEGARIFGSRIEVSPGEWIGIDLKAQKYTSGNQINQMHLVEGVWPPGDREIVIDRYKLDDTHASLGDYLTVELPSGNTRLLKVVGVVQDQTIGAYRGAGGFFSAPVQGYINQDTVEWLEQPLPKRFNILFVTIVGDSKDRQHLESIWQNVRREIEQYDVDIISSTQRSSYEHPNLYLSTAILNVLVVIGLLVSFLSGFLITNTLQAIMNQQVTQIGILKTVGARRGQISTIYLLLSLLFGVIAFLIAAPPSALLAFRIIDFLNIQMNYTFLGPRLIPEVVIIQALIAMLMPLAAALFPVWQGTRISVQEALSGLRQDHPPDQGWLDRRLSGLRKVSLLLVVGLRNTIRRKGRLALTLVTLTLGGAVFIATFNVRVSMMDYIQQITQYFQADVNITLDRVYFTDEIAKAIVEVPGVKEVEGWMFARTEIIQEDGSIGESVGMLAPPVSSQLVKPIMISGRWLVPGDRNAVTLSELFLEAYPDLTVGDTLRLRVNGDETDWVVVGFFQLAGKVSGYSAYTSYEYLADLLHMPGKAISYRVVASKMDLTRGEQEVLGQAIEAHLAASGIRTVDMTTGESLTRTASDGFNVLTAFLLFLALLTALVGSIGLAGTMSLNVMERTREIGILRAIGAADTALMRIVLVEGAFIGFLSWLFSSLAAFPISEIMSDSVSIALFGGPANFGFSPTGFVIWAVLVVLLAVSASVIPAYSSTRLTIREVLAYE